MTYRIRNWAQYFETHETRKMKRLSWVPIPNKHDGLGYRLLMAKPNGYQHYAAWLLLVQVASKCPIRGTLADDSGQALSAEALAAKTGAPSGAFAAAFVPLVQIGWLEDDGENLPASPGAPGARPGVPGDAPVGREGKGREQKGKEITASFEAEKLASKPPSPVLLTFETVGRGAKSWDLTKEQVEQWRALYPNLDILGECRQALAWTQAQPDKRKTARGMPSFLVRWFNRSVDRGPCARQDAAFGGNGSGQRTFGPAKTKAELAREAEWKRLNQEREQRWAEEDRAADERKRKAASNQVARAAPDNPVEEASEDLRIPY